MLLARRDTVREVPAERSEQAELAGLPAGIAARLRYGCFLEEDVYAYDPEFFGINAQEAPWVDPEHRLPSEVAWEALEHAGLPVNGLSGPTGMFFGIYQKDYMQRMQRPLEEVNAYAMYTGRPDSCPLALAATRHLHRRRPQRRRHHDHSPGPHRHHPGNPAAPQTGGRPRPRVRGTDRRALHTPGTVARHTATHRLP